jgi:glycosyltransferase involved in cell wall biosynthesis
MKVLFVSALLPYPPRSGGQIRMYNLLKRLAKKHEITLVSFIRDEKERQYAPELKFCKDVVMVMRGRGMQMKYVLKTLTSSYPLLLATYDNGEMRQAIAGMMEKESFDLVHLEPFYVWPSLPKTDVPLVVSEHNIEYNVYGDYARHFWIPFLRPFLFLDVVKLRIWEEKVWKRASKITAVSGEDASTISLINDNVDVVPNGVDIRQFPFEEKRPKRQDPVVLFVGDFRWFPNTDAVKRLIRDVWPSLRERFPHAQLRIVGRNVSWRLRAAIRAAGGDLRSDVADIPREYRDADVLVAPHAIGGGTKFKMLEAMASGLPIVTTSEGMKGLDATAGTHYLKAVQKDDYVAQVVKIWENTILREKIIRAARALVEEKYNWDTIADELDRVWKKQ